MSTNLAAATSAAVVATPHETRQGFAHRAFLAGAALKGLNALLECFGGIAVALISSDSVMKLANWLTQEALVHDEPDWLGAKIQQFSHAYSLSEHGFVGIYLLAHGLVKLAVTYVLLKKILWAFPIAIAVLFAFACYEAHRVWSDGSMFMAAIAVFDVLLIALVWNEYRVARKRRAPGAVSTVAP